MKKFAFAIAVFCMSLIGASLKASPCLADEYITNPIEYTLPTVTPSLTSFEAIKAEKLTSPPPEQNVVPQPTPGKSSDPAEKKVEPTVAEEYGDCRTWTTFKYAKFIGETAKKYEVDPQVIYATIMTESEGDEWAFRYEPHINDASLGMGQILINTARSLGFSGPAKDMYDPAVSIDLIGKYHRRMLDDFGSLTPNQLATAYNAGSPWNRPVPGHIYRFEIWYSGGSI